MHVFIITRRNGIAGGAYIAVMHQKMLAAKMRIEHHRHQYIGEPTVASAGLVHKLMRIIDANRARHHAKGKKQPG